MRELFFYDKWCIFIYLRLNYLALNGSFSYDVSLYFKALVQIAADLAPKKESLGTGSCAVFHVSDGRLLCVPDKQIDRIAQYLVSVPVCFVRHNIDLELNITTLQPSRATYMNFLLRRSLRLVYQKLMFTC
jgi:hypothetical protein